MSNAINQGQGEAREKPPALSAVRVSKRFGVVRALDDVTLAIHAGEILALVGENGAGKSTLVRVFEGVFAPDQGEIFARGVRQVLRSPADAHALGIRVIHQEPDIVPDLTMAEISFSATSSASAAFSSIEPTSSSDARPARRIRARRKTSGRG